MKQKCNISKFTASQASIGVYGNIITELTVFLFMNKNVAYSQVTGGNIAHVV